jgi:Protein of unknown function (DUF3307)
MINSVLFLLVLLQLKHWYIDFIDQTNVEIASKGIYGDSAGIEHSVKHGIGTMFCVIMVTGIDHIVFVSLLALLDAVFHYHIDWVKYNYGRKDISQKLFWIDLGLDQMMHQLTYIAIAYLII